MDGILNWVGNILFYYVLVTVVENLLPGKKYSRYVRLAAGMVLILLVLKPVTEGFHLEEQITRGFESFTYQQDARDLSREILGIERQRLAKVMDSYEQAVEANVNAMAAEEGFVTVKIQAVMDRDEGSQDWGAVVGIQMEVRGKEDENEKESHAVQAVNPVEPVTVNLKGTEEDSGKEQGEPKELEQLRRKVESYYGLEAGKVEITYKGE